MATHAIRPCSVPEESGPQLTPCFFNTICNINLTCASNIFRNGSFPAGCPTSCWISLQISHACCTLHISAIHLVVCCLYFLLSTVVLWFRIPLRAFLRIIWAALPCGAVQGDYDIHLRVLSGRAWLTVCSRRTVRCALEGEEGPLLATPVLKSVVDGRLSCFVKSINQWFQIFSARLRSIPSVK